VRLVNKGINKVQVHVDDSADPIQAGLEVRLGQDARPLVVALKAAPRWTFGNVHNLVGHFAPPLPRQR
jgi:hypothetical protein